MVTHFLLKGYMSKLAYKEIRLGKASLEIVSKANEIIDEYQEQGFTLTLRQLYYQFVSRDIIPNNMQSYKRLGNIINDARLTGLIDWEAIEDRTRELSSLSTWDKPSSIVRACAEQFRIDYWATQSHYIEVWVEKEALAGVVESVCNKYRVPYLSCRGYTSQSEMWRAGRRLANRSVNKNITILHLGDHDPSGIDMSRDIQDRLTMFNVTDFDFIRLALNMNQVNKYNPPPNPAKTTDSRFAEYRNNYGEDSWELDALEPKIITKLISTHIEERIDIQAWEEAIALENEHKDTLGELADRAEE